MKKFIAILLCLSMLTCVTVVFTSCDKDGDAASTTTVATTTRPDIDDDDDDDDDGGTTAATTTVVTTASIPDGYKLFANDDIAFVYPEDWTKVEEGGEVKLSSASGFSIIQVDPETPSAFLELREEDLETVLRSSAADDGVEIANIVVDTETKDGVTVRVITMETTVSGITVYQTIYVLKVDTVTYGIILTEYTPDEVLKATFWDSLCVVETAPAI